MIACLIRLTKSTSRATLLIEQPLSDIQLPCFFSTCYSSGDAAPNLALGQLAVLQGRYTITYRMVNAILVLLISDPSTNAFVCLRLLDACSKVLVGACKGVDVTPERLSKRYADVHSLLGGLVSGGLAALPPAFVHTSATDERLLGVPLSAADAARRLRKIVAGGKTSAFGPEKAADGSEPTPMPMPETPTKRDGKKFSLEGGDPLRTVEFFIPADALPPPPARAMGAKRRPPAPPPIVSVIPPTVFKGALEQEAAKNEVEGFGAFAPVELLEAEKAAAEEEEKGSDWEAEFNAEEAKAAAEEEEEEPSGPGIADLRDSLQLVEIYQGEVAGGQLQRARIDGAVRRRLAPFGLEAGRFRLVPSPTLVVNACLQTASRNSTYTTHADGGYGFTATLTGAPMDCSYVKYGLPSVACNPPLQVDLLVAPPSGVPVPGKLSALQWEALIVLQFASNPELQGPLLDVVVEVDLPPEMGVLVKTSPSAQWSPDECRLRWNLGRVFPGATGLARAVVGAKPGVDAERAAMALQDSTTARVVFTGWPGQALSGAGFEISMPGEGEPKYHKGRAVWFGEMLVKP